MLGLLDLEPGAAELALHGGGSGGIVGELAGRMEAVEGEPVGAEIGLEERPEQVVVQCDGRKGDLKAPMG